jgi:predicted nucleic acid-binding protein
VLFDTSAWIELFLGSRESKKVKEILKRETCYTSVITLAEVSKWAHKYGHDATLLVNTIDELSTVLNLDKQISLLAGQINIERRKVNKKFGLVDSIILATGVSFGLKILTKDRDFAGFPDIELL